MTGWTGGQYSLFRVIFGLYLCLHFMQLIPWAAELFSDAGVLPDASSSPLSRLFPNVLTLYDPPWFAAAFVAAGALFAVALALGWRDRLAALALWYIWACLFGRNPLTSNPGLPYVGLMLLAHALIPPAPYGSLSARGRVDPAGGWFLPRNVWGVVWVLMAVGYTYSGLTKLVSPSWLDGSAIAHVLENPLARPTSLRTVLLALPAPVLQILTWTVLTFEIAFAPLTLIRRMRPWVWLAALLMHLGLIVLIDFADLSFGMVLLHLFTFNPGWIRPREPAVTETFFYDGHCGLCHRAVRFVLSEDRHDAFRFAPLQGPTFAEAVPADRRAELPDSVVVLTADGAMLTRSDAILHILARLGGVWRGLAVVSRLVPRPLRNTGYDAIARVRLRLFEKPKDACPMLPPELRSRFGM